MRVPKSTQHYQVFACMTAMLLDHRLDSARHVYSSVSKCDNIVSMNVALQSYNEIDGIVAYFFRIWYMCDVRFALSASMVMNDCLACCLTHTDTNIQDLTKHNQYSTSQVQHSQTLLNFPSSFIRENVETLDIFPQSSNLQPHPYSTLVEQWNPFLQLLSPVIYCLYLVNYEMVLYKSSKKHQLSTY